MDAGPTTVSGFLQHQIGDRIKGRYEVVRRLGGGNFGSVYLVRDHVVGVPLACKELHVLDDAATPGNERSAGLALFMREALNLATLRHPNIPAAYFEQESGSWWVCPQCGRDFGTQGFCPQHGDPLQHLESRYYLMLDYIDGPSLEELAVEQLRREGKPLEESACLEWIGQIASALRTLHSVGIIHRDVKPDNIKLRTSDNMAMLLDFGLTKPVEEAGGYGTVRMTGTGRFGTVGYAPLNPQELAHPEKRSDIHALGMTLYRLLCGRDPQNQAELRAMRTYAPRQLNAAISPAVEQIIQRCIATDLSRRYQSIEDLISDLEALRAPAASAYRSPPFTFAHGGRARNPVELARLVQGYPEEATSYLFNGMLVEWLRQNGYAAPAQAAEQAIGVFSGNRPRALEVFRRALFPPGARGVLPQVQVEPPLLDFGVLESGEHKTLGLHVRNIGSGLAWGTVIPDGLPGLEVPQHFQSNDLVLDAALDTSRVQSGEYAGALQVQVEDQVVHVPVQYTVRPLQLQVSPARLDFGTLLKGDRATRELDVHPVSPTGGVPRGTLYPSPSLRGLQVPERFQGTEPIPLEVHSDRSEVVAGSYSGFLQVDTNGGRFRVPVSYRITLPAPRLLGLVATAAIQDGICGLLLRLAYLLVNPAFSTRWLLDQRGVVAFSPTAAIVGWALLGGAAGAYGGLLGSREIVNRAKKAATDAAHKMAAAAQAPGAASPVAPGTTASPGLQPPVPLRTRTTANLPPWIPASPGQAAPPGPAGTAPIPAVPHPGTAPAARPGNPPVAWQRLPDVGLIQFWSSLLPIVGIAAGVVASLVAAAGLHWAVWGLGDWLLYPLVHLIDPRAGGGWVLVAWTGAGVLVGLLRGIAASGNAAGTPWLRYVVWGTLAFGFLALLINAMLMNGV